jgi:hypothetical protein
MQVFSTTDFEVYLMSWIMVAGYRIVVNDELSNEKISEVTFIA